MDEVRVRRVYISFAKRHGLKPIVLEEIVFFRTRGYSNLEISDELGVSRNTVASYLEKLRKMQEDELAEMMSLIGALKRRNAYLLERRKESG